MADQLLYVDRYICFEMVQLQNEADYHASTHWNLPYMNNANTIFCFLSGSWSAVVEGAPYSFEPWDLCLTKCLESCIIQPLSYPCSMWRISFSPYYFRVIDPNAALCQCFTGRSLGVGNRVTPAQYQQERFATILSRVPQCATMADKQLSLTVALADLLYDLNLHFDHAAPDTRPADVRAILDYINAHYCDDIALTTLTQVLYISRSQLAKVMKRATGFTTWDYILNKRIFRAIQLLHDGMSNRDVAKATGFRDYSTFYKAFFKITSNTPNSEHPSAEWDPHLENFYEQERAVEWIREMHTKRRYPAQQIDDHNASDAP